MKNTMNRFSSRMGFVAVNAISVVSAIGLLIASSGIAQGESILMLDFGSATAASGAVGPAHSPNNGEGVLNDSADTTWNQIDADVSSGSLFADGGAATGVTVDLGIETAGTSSIIGWSDNGTTASVGTHLSTIQDNDVMNDYLRPTTTGDGREIGVRVQGLDPGVYDVYVAGFLTFAGDPGRDQLMYVGVQPAGTFNSGTTDYSGFTNELLENSLDVDGFLSDTWSSDDNYAKFTVTLDSSNPELVVVGAFGGAAGSSQGLLSAIQIVEVIPEPSSTILLTLFGGVVLAVRRCRGGLKI